MLGIENSQEYFFNHSEITFPIPFTFKLCITFPWHCHPQGLLEVVSAFPTFEFPSDIQKLSHIFHRADTTDSSSI